MQLLYNLAFDKTDPFFEYLSWSDNICSIVLSALCPLSDSGSLSSSNVIRHQRQQCFPEILSIKNVWLFIYVNMQIVSSWWRD